MLYFMMTLLASVHNIVASIQSNVITQHGKNIHIDDEFIASTSIELKAKSSIIGKGLIAAPHITINAKKFEFIGTIDCSDTCHITIQEPFDETMFTRKGSGSFTITIDPQLNLDETINISLPTANPPLSVQPPLSSPSSAQKTITIEGSTFTISGAPLLAMADAIEKDDLNRVKELLAAHALMFQDKDQLSFLLLLAGLSGHTAIAEEFIHAGADVNGRDSTVGIGQAHIITAVGTKRADFVALLVQAGANPNVTTRDFTPALIIAAQNKDLASVQALLASPDIKVNARDMHRQTALMIAAYHGAEDIVQALVIAGAEMHAQDKKGLYAADYARTNNHQALVTYLEGYRTKRSNAIITDADKPSINERLYDALWRPEMLLLGVIIGAIMVRR